LLTRATTELVKCRAEEINDSKSKMEKQMFHDLYSWQGICSEKCISDKFLVALFSVCIQSNTVATSLSLGDHHCTYRLMLTFLTEYNP
jgi:hypothetical protein